MAVDAGGTTTRAVLLDESGVCLGVGRAGGANPIAVGTRAAVANVVNALVKAAAGFRSSAPELVLMTMAGAITHNDLGGEETQLRAAGIRAPIEFEADIHRAWFSGTASGDGTVLVVGTGSVAGVVSGGRLARVVDGGGWLLGDTGSGFWIGQEIVRAVAEHLDGRGPGTALTDAVLATIGQPADMAALGTSERSHALLRHVYGAPPIALAHFAPLVMRFRVILWPRTSSLVPRLQWSGRQASRWIPHPRIRSCWQAVFCSRVLQSWITWPTRLGPAVSGSNPDWLALRFWPFGTWSSRRPSWTNGRESRIPCDSRRSPKL